MTELNIEESLVVSCGGGGDDRRCHPQQARAGDTSRMCYVTVVVILCQSTEEYNDNLSNPSQRT